MELSVTSDSNEMIMLHVMISTVQKLFLLDPITSTQLMENLFIIYTIKKIAQRWLLMKLVFNLEV